MFPPKCTWDRFQREKKNNWQFPSPICFKCFLFCGLSLHMFRFSGVTELKMLLNWRDTTSNEAAVQNGEQDWCGKASGSAHERVPNPSALSKYSTPRRHRGPSAGLSTFWRMGCSSLSIHNEEARQKQLPRGRGCSVSLFRGDEPAERSLMTSVMRERLFWDWPGLNHNILQHTKAATSADRDDHTFHCKGRGRCWKWEASPLGSFEKS